MAAGVACRRALVHQLAAPFLERPSGTTRRRDRMMIFVGIDWAEAHHDVCVLDHAGEVLATRRIPDGLEGVARLHTLLAEHADEPEAVVVGIETDRGLLVGALLAAGYVVHAVNPLAASRYRER